LLPFTTIVTGISLSASTGYCAFIGDVSEREDDGVAGRLTHHNAVARKPGRFSELPAPTLLQRPAHGSVPAISGS
jgi:hypothetical protein